MKIISNQCGFTNSSTPSSDDDKFRYFIVAIEERGALPETFFSSEQIINRGEIVQTFFLLREYL